MQKYNNDNQRSTYTPKNNYQKKRRQEPRGGTKGRFVVRRDGESTEQLIKRFKRVVEASGVMKELKRREYYLSPSQTVREKKKKALKRLRKRIRIMESYNKGD